MTSTLAVLALTFSALLCPTPTHAMACWDEPNASVPGGYERIGGALPAPVGAVHITSTYPNCEA